MDDVPFRRRAASSAGSRRRSSSGSSRSGGSPGHIPDSSDYVPTITPFDPEIHKALLFDLMRESGVQLLLHALVVDAVLRRATDACRGATFATVGGRARVRARCTIDATADAFVAAAAGCALQQGDERGRVQPASLMFRLSHVDMDALAAYVRAHPDQMRTSLAAGRAQRRRATAVAGLYELWRRRRPTGSTSRASWCRFSSRRIPTR